MNPQPSTSANHASRQYGAPNPSSQASFDPPSLPSFPTQPNLQSPPSAPSSNPTRRILAPSSSPLLRPPAIRFVEGGTRTCGIEGLRDWQQFRHINGSVYYYHPKLRLIAVDDIRDRAVRRGVLQVYREAMQAVDELMVQVEGESRGGRKARVRTMKFRLPPDAQLLVRLGESEDIDEAIELARGEFFSPAEEQFITVGEEGVAVETRTVSYWTFLEQHPMHLTHLSGDARSTFLSALAYGANAAALENRNSKFPLTDGQMERLLRIYKDLDDATATNPAVIPILIWHVAHTLNRIESSRRWFRVAHPAIKGFFGFKLQYLHSARHDRHWSFQVAEWALWFLLFQSHKSYWTRLAQVREKVSVDLGGFRALLMEFLEEWSDSNLLATLLLGANVTLLSLGNINSLQRTFCIASTMLGTPSILTGLYQVWRHRSKTNADIIEAAKYMDHTRSYDARTDDPSDLIIMASFLAIPIAALLWSIACFVLAIGAYSVQGTDPTGRVMLPVVLGVSIVVGGTCALFPEGTWNLPKGGHHTSGSGGASAATSPQALNGPENFAGGL